MLQGQIPLTLNHDLVTGNQYLLAVAGLCVLEDGGPRVGCSGCVGHGQRGEALDAVGAIISQLDGPALRDRNCAGGKGRPIRNQRRREEQRADIKGDLLYCPLLVW